MLPSGGWLGMAMDDEEEEIQSAVLTAVFSEVPDEVDDLNFEGRELRRPKC